MKLRVIGADGWLGKYVVWHSLDRGNSRHERRRKPGNTITGIANSHDSGRLDA